ncbi:MAG TPA: calcium-binding protein [Pyrinomonadaceae bacterium]|nr:calcium-binding protein [Pyrinomonadaceae bacterium]
MERVERDEKREERITFEAVVDAYDEMERALGWYYYLEGKITFPFEAVCTEKKRASPLKENEIVEVIGMAPEEECENSMFVEIEWGEDDFLDVPLEQIYPIGVDEDTKEAVEDWHYWVARGYQF